MTGNLPILIEAQQVAVAKSRSNSLIGRGLSSIQSGVYTLAIADRDALYRKARDTYNCITDDGCNKCFDEFWMPEDLVELRATYETFKRLADVGYGKSYFPLFTFYDGGLGITENEERARCFAKMAFDWCFANQLLNDPEIWHDLGTLYRLANGTVTVLIRNDDVCYRMGAATKADYEQAVFWYRQAAEAGYATAMFSLCCMYAAGDEVEPDLDEALSWQIAAAEAGHIDAQYGLGMQYEHGNEQIKQDGEQAFYWYLQAAERDHLKALSFVADMSWYGYGLPDGDALALDWYRKQAEQGQIWAQWFLADAYRNGRGIDRDYVKAAYWYRQAAELGEPKAQWKLGLMYWGIPAVSLESEDVGSEYDLEQARNWLTKAAAEGMPDAQYDLAGLLLEIDEDEEAWLWMEAASDQGYGPAQLVRANRHAIDYVTEEERENLIDQAIAWYVERVEQGDAERQYEYALMHLRNEIPTASRSEGLYWLRKSADQNHRRACTALGRNLLNDRGEEATREAILWLEHAAELGDAWACNVLGDLYLLGHAGRIYEKQCRPQLVLPNSSLAVEWYERGIALGWRAVAYHLGCLYLDGKHLMQDAFLAEKWLLHAANAGNYSAQLVLGKEYASGLRLNRNAGQAIHWLAKASESLVSTGLILGKIYLEGDLVARDFNKAIQCLTHATESDTFRVAAMKIVEAFRADGRLSASEETEAQEWLANQAALAIRYYTEAAEFGNYKAKERLLELGIDWENH